MNKLMTDNDISTIQKRYAERLANEPENWGKVGYVSQDSQVVRFEKQAEIYKMCESSPTKSTMIDVGSGLGDFYAFVRNKLGEPLLYTGIDILQEMVDQANRLYPHEKHPNVRFARLNILEDSVDEHDFGFCSGALTPRLADNDAFIEAMIKRMTELSRMGATFNFLQYKNGEGVPKRKPDLYYYDLKNVLGMCKGMFDGTVDVHSASDYHPIDATVFVVKKPKTIVTLEPFKKASCPFSA